MDNNNQVTAETLSRCKWCGGALTNAKRGARFEHTDECRIVKVLRIKRWKARQYADKEAISKPVPPAPERAEGGHLRVRDLQLKMLRCPFCSSEILAQLELFVFTRQGDRLTK